MIGNVLSLAAGYLARLEADTGNRQAALAAMASSQRFVSLADTLGAAKFIRQCVPAGIPGQLRLPGEWARLWSPRATVWRRRLRNGTADRSRLDQAYGAAQGRRRTPAAGPECDTGSCVPDGGRCFVSVNDYATADADIRHAVELRKAMPARSLGERRDEASQATLAAMIAARLERYAEAHRLIDPVLELHRGLFARADNEDLTQHIEFAQALYVSALARSSARVAELKQAAAIIDALPAPMRALISVGRIRASIAEAQGS